MGTYNLPRDVKGEGRILFVFSTKALIWTATGALLGLPFYLLFSLIGVSIVGIIAIALFGLAGFVIATFKMPTTNTFEITKKTGGENIDDVIKRWFKFKMQKSRIYVYQKETKEEAKKDE